MNKEDARVLNEKMVKLVWPKARIRYVDEEGFECQPQYIPSGKSWRTHAIDVVPLPSFVRDLNACVIHLVPLVDAAYFDIAGGRTIVKLCKGDTFDEKSWALAESTHNPAVAFCLALEKLLEQQR